MLDRHQQHSLCHCAAASTISTIHLGAGGRVVIRDDDSLLSKRRNYEPSYAERHSDQGTCLRMEREKMYSRRSNLHHQIQLVISTWRAAAALWYMKRFIIYQTPSSLTVLVVVCCCWLLVPLGQPGSMIDAPGGEVGWPSRSSQKYSSAAAAADFEDPKRITFGMSNTSAKRGIWV